MRFVGSGGSGSRASSDSERNSSSCAADQRRGSDAAAPTSTAINTMAAVVTRRLAVMSRLRSGSEVQIERDRIRAGPGADDDLELPPAAHIESDPFDRV